MRIRDLGTLTGRPVLFGGPYSNLQATRAFLRRARTLGGALICTGDVVGYGADPLATLTALHKAGAVVVAGNVERQLAAGGADCGCGFAPDSTCARLAQGWWALADAQVPRSWRDWMRDLPDLALFTHAGRRWAVVHGGATDIARFIWPTSPEADFTREFTAIEAAVGPIDGVIAGHSGIAFARRVAGRLWVNAGALGLPPHDGRPLTRFATLAEDGVRFHRLAYDHHAAAAAMKAAGLAGGYANTLLTGLWPSQDILPEEMRR